MTVNLNQVAITGNLTHEPLLVTLPSGQVHCELRLASHHRARDQITGVWEERTDYFTVRASGFQARTAYSGLEKGSGVAIAGRLSSRPGAERDQASGRGGGARGEVEIVAEAIQFLARARARPARGELRGESDGVR